MRTRTKGWLLTAASLVVFGCILFAGVMMALHWDFMKLQTVEYETNVYEISEAFDSISVNTETADLAFVLSDRGICSVECYEETNTKHTVTVKDGKLTVELREERSIKNLISLNFGTPKITVYLPKTEYASLRIRGTTGDVVVPDDFMFQEVDISLSTGDASFCAYAAGAVKIKTSTGDICTENTSIDALNLAVSTGKVTVSHVTCSGDVTVSVSTGKTYLTDVVCKSVQSSGSTGDISLSRVVAADKITIGRSTGDVRFVSADAAEIFVKTDTGDVTGSLLTDKVFLTQTDTGDVHVPKTVHGGRCEILTDTGDIEITVP